MNTILNKIDATFITAKWFNYLRHKKGKLYGYERVDQNQKTKHELFFCTLHCM